MELILRNNIGELLVLVKDIDKQDYSPEGRSYLAEHIMEAVEAEKEKE